MAEEGHPIVDIFKARKSIRNYTSWTEENQRIVEEIVNEANSLPTPFGTPSTIGLHGPGLGTMGFVSGEAGWIVLKIPQDKVNTEEYKKYVIDAAFKAHVAVLKMTAQKIGTVWIGGTFSESKAEQDIPGFKIPCVVAFGTAAETKRFFDKAVSFIGTGASRKTFTDIFVNEENGKPVKEEEAGKLHDFLWCLRSSPSAMNAQPARISFKNNTFALFDAKDNSYTAFDMGIMLASAFFFADGNVTFNVEQGEKKFPSGGKYVISFTVDPKVF